MAEENLMELLKSRILGSFRWQEDVIIPLSNELEIPKEEFEEILMDKLDMSSLENLHATFESAKPKCFMERLNADLKLCWLVNVLELIKKEDYIELKKQLMIKIAEGQQYEDILEFGKKEVYKLLKS